MLDPVKEFAIRNKDSPIDIWEQFQPYNRNELNFLYFTNIDGVRLKFKHVELTINGRHKNK